MRKLLRRLVFWALAEDVRQIAREEAARGVSVLVERHREYPVFR